MLSVLLGVKESYKCSQSVTALESQSSDETTAAIEEIMEKMLKQARMQFGAAVKAFWFYDGDLCPGCLQHSIGVVKFKGKEALAIDAFIYRERGVLIE